MADDTSEELVLAAVDGELVNRALDRLSARHRHVLAMREGSGWTYQQIADHEGVEIGTIETLLWRARQALKREFAAVSESKGALAGFLVASGALFRRAFFRVAHRGATVQQQTGGTSGGMGLRNALAGAAVAGAAVAAAFIAPHALKGNDTNARRPAAPEASALAAPPLALAPGNGHGTRRSGSEAALGAVAGAGRCGRRFAAARRLGLGHRPSGPRRSRRGSAAAGLAGGWAAWPQGSSGARQLGGAGAARA